MGTICIFLGLILFIASLLGGALFSRVMIENYPAWQATLPAVLPKLTNVQMYAVGIGIFGFIGLLICLNLVMHGLTYNKVLKLIRMHKR